MKLEKFVEAMERIAPPALALDYDNPGLNIEPQSHEINRVLVALDCTPAVAREAVEWGADLVLTHHPLFFHGAKHLGYNDPDSASAMILVQHGIGHYSAHTNLDAAEGGVNDVLAHLMELTDIEPFAEGGLGRIGNVCFTLPTDLADYAELCEEKLGCTALAVGDPKALVTRVAVIGGAGGDEVREAAAAGADLFITGELKHHQALEAQVLGISVLACGHYETEMPVLKPLIERLQAVQNDVQYKIAHSDESPLRRIRR